MLLPRSSAAMLSLPALISAPMMGSTVWAMLGLAQKRAQMTAPFLNVLKFNVFTFSCFVPSRWLSATTRGGLWFRRSLGWL